MTDWKAKLCMCLGKEGGVVPHRTSIGTALHPPAHLHRTGMSNNREVHSYSFSSSYISRLPEGVSKIVSSIETQHLIHQSRASKSSHGPAKRPGTPVSPQKAYLCMFQS